MVNSLKQYENKVISKTSEFCNWGKKRNQFYIYIFKKKHFTFAMAKGEMLDKSRDIIYVKNP